VRLALFLFATVAASAGFALAAQTVTIEKHLHLRVSMRDGVHLDTNVFLPAGGHRVSALLVRTPYGKGVDLFPGYPAFLEHGYAVVTQDVRGRFASEGLFDSIHNEGSDGSETIDWIARQPWSNGRVGMVGGSYLGIVQWKTAILGNPHLKAICPVVSGDDDYTDRFYSTGGASKLGHRLLWMSENLLAPGFALPTFQSYIYHLPLRSIDRAATGQPIGFYQQALDHPAYDDYWKKLSVREQLKDVTTPVFSVGGWYDNYVEGDLDAFTTLRKKGTAHKNDLATSQKVTSVVEVAAKAVKGGRSYEWQYSTDGGKTWIGVQPTTQAKVSIPNLQPGVVTQFRQRAVTKSGPTDWSNPVTTIVT